MADHTRAHTYKHTHLGYRLSCYLDSDCSFTPNSIQHYCLSADIARCVMCVMCMMCMMCVLLIVASMVCDFHVKDDPSRWQRHLQPLSSVGTETLELLQTKQRALEINKVCVTMDHTYKRSHSHSHTLTHILTHTHNLSLPFSRL